MQPISSTPSITRRGVPHNFDTMVRSDSHNSNSTTGAPTPVSVNESLTTAHGVTSTRSKGRRTSGFSLKKTGVDFESILFKKVPGRLLTPRSVANHIRRLRQHDETTISQRHMVAAEHVSYADKVTLKLLCKKLLQILCRR